MTDQDHARIAAAREKRRRKLERFTQTPQAKARALEMAKAFDGGTPMTFPPPPTND